MDLSCTLMVSFIKCNSQSISDASLFFSSSWDATFFCYLLLSSSFKWFTRKAIFSGSTISFLQTFRFGCDFYEIIKKKCFLPSQIVVPIMHVEQITSLHLWVLHQVIFCERCLIGSRISLLPTNTWE